MNRIVIALALLTTLPGCLRVHLERSEVPDPDAKPGFEGRWDTNYGVVDLARTEGGTFVGGWDQDGGRLVGTLSPDGRTLRASWSSAPSYRPPREAGTVTFTLTDDGRTIDGTWGYGNGAADPTPWRGERLPATPGDGWTPPMKQRTQLIFEW